VAAPASAAAEVPAVDSAAVAVAGFRF
jgi:hypothetical protein